MALPGFVYHRALARHIPGRVYTPFQELVSILFVSIIVDGVTVVVLEVGSRFGWWFSPSFRSAFDRPHAYATEYFTALVVWGAAALALACAAAYTAGAGRWSHVLPGQLRERLRERSRRLEPQHSAWWLLFREHLDAEVYVGCVLDDGSYLSGVLHSYSKVPAEHGDRELSLRGDILYRPPGETAATVLPQVNAVSVSARRLVFLTVSYLPAPTAAVPPLTAPVSPEAPAASEAPTAGSTSPHTGAPGQTSGQVTAP